MSGTKSIRDNHLQTGSWAESCAVKYFLGRSWQVFTNFSGFGPADIVCVNSGEGQAEGAANRCKSGDREIIRRPER